MVDGFKRVQLLWDETMAQNIARYLASPQGEGKRLLFIAGGNHVRNGFGIPRRVFRRLPHSYLLIGSREIEIPADKQDRLMDVEIPGFPMVPFDFLLHTAYEDLGTEKVRLGVVLEEVEGAVRIKEVMAGSNGERAGLKEGDIIRRIDGEPVAESFDLVYAVQQKRAGDSATLQVERDGATQEVAVTFLATQKPPHHPQR
jgi:membrane-associated protease RseP (regulator of RpoE activity)